VTDDLSAYGLGALPDAPDERDYPLSALYASEGLTASVVLAATYAAPGMPSVLDQHATPMCVAYSSSAMKAWQDRRDQERFFDFDEPAFFAAIGGTSAGAYVRDAMERMRTAGSPPSWRPEVPFRMRPRASASGRVRRSGTSPTCAPGRASPLSSSFTRAGRRGGWWWRAWSPARQTWLLAQDSGELLSSTVDPGAHEHFGLVEELCPDCRVRPWDGHPFTEWAVARREHESCA
jgi:hypothetical protein